MSSAKPCSVLMYLPTGNPLGLRTAAVRGQTCRVSVAPPGEASELERFQLRGPAIALTWRESSPPIISVSPDVENLSHVFRHAAPDVAVALVSGEQDFLPVVSFAVTAEILAERAGVAGMRRATADPWSQCVGQVMAETALLLLAVHRVPGFV